ncbi:DedA family protein [Pseudooceanicola algae]|uniref:Inner membrane protein YabI n=1 Tax=Pseudooceanicola algae TaxID=1537215 RepID=A0A418SDS4_9RHOB|nr:VTT domain-containing protein [Pseudooceanicola algae]QPM89438.1 Inner membrane protein YabI [Pseudooceanicola algae]
MMNEEVLRLLVSYGPGIIFAVTFTSCIALPVPASLVMLGAGALAAAGDMPFWGLLVSAYVGAVLGDIAGYGLAILLEGALKDRLRPGPRTLALTQEARRRLLAHGGKTVFLSRWLLSPLGPYVNFAAGAARMPMRQFLPSSAAGEVIWVGFYLGIGHAAARHLPKVTEIASNVAGLILAGAVACGILFVLHLRLRRSRRRGDSLPES